MKLKSLSFLSTAICAVLIFQSYSSGPARDNNTTVTGAPFNSNQTCSRCHSGGSFGGSIKTELLDAGNNAVSAYMPGANYTFRITMSKTTGTPKYGFQTTAALSSNSTNLNNWGALPANTHNELVSNRNYIEQSNKLSSGIIDIPWSAPAKGAGSVTFWTAGNIVNGTGSTSGDQPVSTNLVIQEDQLVPVTIKYFKGSIVNGDALLEWATAQEVNNKEFIIEKSFDSRLFSQVATIPASKSGIYSWSDYAFNDDAFYRLTQVDLDGRKNVYSIIEVKTVKAAYSIGLKVHAGNSFIMFNNSKAQQAIEIKVYDMSGKIIHTQKTTASEGSNMYALPVKVNGVYIIAIQTQDGIRTTSKVRVVR